MAGANAIQVPVPEHDAQPAHRSHASLSLPVIRLALWNRLSITAREKNDHFEMAVIVMAAI